MLLVVALHCCTADVYREGDFKRLFSKTIKMSEVLKLGITNNNNKKIKEVKSFEVLANKGVIGDRHFKNFNDPFCQLTLIESENIDYYNLKYGFKYSLYRFQKKYSYQRYTAK